MASLPLTHSLPALSLTAVRQLLLSRRLTSVDLLSFCHNRAKLGEAPPYSLNAFTHLPSFESLLPQAVAADCRYDKQHRYGSHHRYDNQHEIGFPLSGIDGIPISLKANISWKGVVTDCSSSILKGYTPPFDSDVALRIIKGGGIIIGQVNMDEFGMGSACGNGVHGLTFNSRVYNPLAAINPLDEMDARSADIISVLPRLSPGGSSGGSASSVAFRSSFASIGTDTGGSIRLPAAWSGLTGFKPTYGRVSRHGVVAYASSLDTVGVIAQSPLDCGIVMDVISGHSEKDMSSIRNAGNAGNEGTNCDNNKQSTPNPSNKHATTNAPLTGLTVGLPSGKKCC